MDSRVSLKSRTGSDWRTTDCCGTDLCLEKRAFYRAISGLHTSINIHLCAEYLHGHLVNSNPLAASEPAKWGPNIKEFQSRRVILFVFSDFVIPVLRYTTYS